MPGADQNPKTTIEKLNRRVGQLKLAVVSLMGLCLTISVILNVHLGYAYTEAVKDRRAAMEKAQKAEELYLQYMRLTIDLRAMRRTNPDVKRLLIKHRIPFGNSPGSRGN